MKTIIVYGSKYGSTKKYADALAKKLAVKAYTFDDAKDLDQYEQIVYLGAVFAGGLLGLNKTFKSVPGIEDKKIIIASVGLSDPKDQKNTANIKKGIAKLIPAEVMTKARIFHLRGGIDYGNITKLHSFMMKMVYLRAKAIKDEEKTDEVAVFIDTYGKKVNFVDLDSLKPLIEAAK